MSSLPIELWRRISRIRTDLCYQSCRCYWKKEWLKNISCVNDEYSCIWVWDDYLHSNQAVWNHCFNYRHLQSPQSYLFDKCSEKMYIHRRKPNISLVSVSNYPMMHYFYSIRPEFECTDWFLRFLKSKYITE